MQDIRVCAHTHCYCESTHVLCDLFARAYIVESKCLGSTLCWSVSDLLTPLFLQELIKSLLIQQSDRVKDSKQEEEQDD